MRKSSLIVVVLLGFFVFAPVSFATRDEGTIPVGTGTVLAPGVVNNGTIPQGNGNSAPNITLINPLNIGSCTAGQNCLLAFLMKILQLVIQIGVVVIVFMIVYIGYMFVMAQGKDAELIKARQALLWTVIGALVLLGAETIAKGIQATVTSLGI